MSETLSVIVHKTIETNPLSVSSEIVASVSMPPCAQKGEDGTENDVDNDDVNKFIHKLDILRVIQYIFTTGMPKLLAFLKV